eukprot:scaffold918_cov126-Cylindrotheca_fusiformis.AAC.18
MRGPNHQVAFLSALAFTNTDPSQRPMLHNSPTFLFAGPPQQIADTRNMTMDRSGAFMADQDVFVEPLPLATQKNSDNSVARTASTSSDSVATDASFLSTSESEPPLWTTKSLKSKLVGTPINNNKRTAVVQLSSFLTLAILSAEGRQSP